MKIDLRKILIAIVVAILVLAGGFYAYVSVFYRAEEPAMALLGLEDSIVQMDGHIRISPDDPSDTALIFYPGAKVEYEAYLPLMQRIAQTSRIPVILVEMPFNMAIFDQNAAAELMAAYPTIRRWYVGGHSMGGAMASSYASKNPGKVAGLILLGAYRYGSYPAADALTVYGSFNTSVAEKIDYVENIVVIEGGNHAQFGNYGPQKGDPPATISAEEQQRIAAEAIDAFLTERGDAP